MTFWENQICASKFFLRCMLLMIILTDFKMFPLVIVVFSTFPVNQYSKLNNRLEVNIKHFEQLILAEDTEYGAEFKQLPSD